MGSILFKSEVDRERMREASHWFLAQVPGAVEERYVATRWGRTRVLVTGPEEGPPLVVLHGAMASASHVLPELGPILGHCRVYALDVLGQSPWSEDRKLDDYGGWLDAVTTALGLTRFALLGVSWGGMVALRAALTVAERLSHLVLVVPVGVVTGSVWTGLRDGAWPVMTYRWRPTEARLERIVATQFTNRHAEWERYLGEALLAFRLDFQVPRLGKGDGWERIRCPVLAFGADLDVHAPGEPLLVRLRDWFPQAETELLQKTKHCPPLTPEFRAFLGGRILRFLDATRKGDRLSST